MQKSLLVIPARFRSMGPELQIRLALCVFAVFLAFPLLVFVAPANASEVQIATLNITSVETGAGANSETVSFSNLTSTGLRIQSYTGYYLGNFEFSSGDNVGIAPDSTNPSAFGCSGGCSGWSYVLGGSLSSLDFSAGGEDYQALSISWSTPQFGGDFNGTVPVDIDANDLGPAPTPEPASILLFGTGLLIIVLVMRKRIAQGFPQAS